jgi:hypothetical protein
MHLSKSDFKVARSCGTKLYYRKLRYPSNQDDDPYLEFLADGGYMVSECAGVAIISSSWSIPPTTEDQPPHIETYRRYKETADSLDADLVVTMEHPSKSSPHRVVITIDENGATLKKTITGASITVTSSRSPRVG